MEFYNVVGQNNRNLIVQSKKIAPYHEDITKIQSFEPSTVNPGQYAKIKLDFKHAADREIILNDIRLQFQVDFSASGMTGDVWAVRGTDLIREMTVKINEDVVFKGDKSFELSMLWEMNGHKATGEQREAQDAHLLNYGNIPSGRAADAYIYDARAGQKNWLFTEDGASTFNWSRHILPGEERHDNLPRMIYSNRDGANYMYKFDINLNHVIGPVFHRLHMRRIEYVQIEIMFEPWVSKQQCQNFMMFSGNPGAAHPYSTAKFTNLAIRQYRTTLLDGIRGFTLPDNRMLSWLMHRYSRREFEVDVDNQNSIDIQLHDWEIRTNIVRIMWMWAPMKGDANENYFIPFGDNSTGYERWSGVEILWKNDKVLDLDTHHEVIRHYILSDNKRYGFNDPFIRYARLLPNKWDKTGEEVDGKIEYYDWQKSISVAPVAGTKIMTKVPIGKRHYEFPIYHVDLNMNIQQGAPNAEIIGGIVNDTSDYVIRIKKLSLPHDRFPTAAQYGNIKTGKQTLYVFLEYETLVNLSAGSNQFNRGSQIVTKQLNPQ